jgi:hypothetical protein
MLAPCAVEIKSSDMMHSCSFSMQKFLKSFVTGIWINTVLV